jgi:hypothetical protein
LREQSFFAGAESARVAGVAYHASSTASQPSASSAFHASAGDMRIPLTRQKRARPSSGAGVGGEGVLVRGLPPVERAGVERAERVDRGAGRRDAGERFRSGGGRRQARGRVAGTLTVKLQISARTDVKVERPVMIVRSFVAMASRERGHASAATMSANDVEQQSEVAGDVDAKRCAPTEATESVVGTAGIDEVVQTSVKVGVGDAA